MKREREREREREGLGEIKDGIDLRRRVLHYTENREIDRERRGRR
jgi:hypothetical protein